MQESRNRRARWAGLAILTLGAGCTHNHYYGYGVTPGCPPVATQVGGVCEVPGGTVVGSTTAPAVITSPAASGTVTVAPNAQRVVVSQPATGPGLGTRIRKWSRVDPEAVAASTTKVEGTLDAPAANK